MSKPILVILEGSDKVGKTSVHKLLAHETEHRVMITDRFTGSYIVYGEMNGQDYPSAEKLYEIEDKLSELFTPLLVYLFAPVEELLKRSERAGEIKAEQFYIENIQSFYRKYLVRTKFNQISLDTSLYSTLGCVKIIKDVIEIIREDEK